MTRKGPYIAMEYVAGPDSADKDDWPPTLPRPPLNLETCVREQGTFDALQVAELGRLLCRAMGHAHEHGTFHRDIKPANVLLSEKGEPKLTGFKLKSLADDDQGMGGDSARTADAGLPCRSRKSTPAGPTRVPDIYALGGTLWFLLTGHDPRYFCEADVPQPLHDVLVKALQKNRDRRFQMAGEFEQALASLDFVSGASSMPEERPTTSARASATDSTARSSRASAEPRRADARPAATSTCSTPMRSSSGSTAKAAAARCWSRA